MFSLSDYTEMFVIKKDLGKQMPKGSRFNYCVGGETSNGDIVTFPGRHSKLKDCNGHVDLLLSRPDVSATKGKTVTVDHSVDKSFDAERGSRLNDMAVRTKMRKTAKYRLGSNRCTGGSYLAY